MRIMISTLALVFSVGCGGLEGDWEGSMQCNDAQQKWPAQFTIQQNEFDETAFEGVVGGALPCATDVGDEYDCNFLMSGIIYKEKPSGSQSLDVDMEQCEADGGVQGSIGFGCEDPERANWDGRKNIEIDHQTSGDVLCRISLERQ